MKLVSALIILFCSLSAANAFAADSVCTSTPEVIGGYPWFDILNDRDLREAIRCAVNRAGVEVTGESAFSRLYNVVLPDEFLDRIDFRRTGDYDPISNTLNTYSLRFPAIYEGRLETRVACVLRIELRKHHDRRAVIVNLSDCKSSAFGVDQHGDKTKALEAWALFTFADGKK